VNDRGDDEESQGGMGGEKEGESEGEGGDDDDDDDETFRYGTFSTPEWSDDDTFEDLDAWDLRVQRGGVWLKLPAILRCVK
jgi:hypothetical protein